jgi:hypothetical protein
MQVQSSGRVSVDLVELRAWSTSTSGKREGREFWAMGRVTIGYSDFDVF